MAKKELIQRQEGYIYTIMAALGSTPTTNESFRQKLDILDNTLGEVLFHTPQAASWWFLKWF